MGSEEFAAIWDEMESQLKEVMEDARK